MKFNRSKALLRLAAAFAGATLLAGCAADSPFADEGEGILKLHLAVNTTVTRSADNEDFLRSNCVVYISDTKGLLHKYQGLENVPDEIKLKSGRYVAEAWSGDSVGASFDKKFFRGYTPFEVTKGLTNAVVRCKIQNVVASVNTSSIDPEAMTDWTVTFSHSRAEITIDESTQSEKAYMMLPSADTDLHYTVSGMRADGKPFSKEGVISNVQRAHEYVLNFSYTPDDTQMGGAFIQIVIDDNPITENGSVELFSAPVIKGVNFDLDSQLYAEAGQFGEAVVKVSAFDGIKTLNIESDDWQAMQLPAPRVDLCNVSQTLEQDMRDKGLTWTQSLNSARNLTVEHITFAAKWLNQLPQRDNGYVLTISAEDIRGKVTRAQLRIAVGEGAVEQPAPVLPEETDPDDQMAVLTRKATLYASVYDPTAPGLALQYRKADSGDSWKSVALNPTRAAKTTMKVTLTGLEPSTFYEYRTVADGFESQSLYFTTEGAYTIPNSSMEQWSTGSKDVLIPSADNPSTFWDSGNHGSITLGINLTQPATDILHTGSKAARLRSQKVAVMGLGKFAAGNLFTGSFDGLEGTDGKLTFGRAYDASHPEVLSVWVNYRPQTVQEAKKHLAKGDMDQGQIYVALSTEPVQIRTKNSAKLFNKDDACILAYGEKTFTADFGAADTLENLCIPLEYKEAAKTQKPLYLIIVCTASKFGDFFEGGEGSTMTVDDFELVY